VKEICQDLTDEYESLDAIVASLPEDRWELITPFYYWTIKTEIAHIAYFDGTARLAATDGEGFARHLKEEYQHKEVFRANHERMRAWSPAKVLGYWRQERKAMVDALFRLSPKDRLPWYGPTMSARSFATARIMETWAHGQDIVDTLGIDREPTNRLQHIAHLGVTTFGWSYANRGLQVPDVPFRVELTAPSGELWAWGPEDAKESVRGTAEDFCLVVVQRRHVEDTDLKVEGHVAREWMLIAQAFAGPPAKGPKPGERTGRPGHSILGVR
jgi:uncharacterized protein (TIGR03084 family)